MILTPPAHIIWFHTAFLGDMILLTAAMKHLANVFPDRKQYLISTPLGIAALKHLPFIEACFEVRKGKGQTILAQSKRLNDQLTTAGLSKNNALILRTHGSFRSGLLTKLTGIPSVCHKESQLSFLSGYQVPRVAVMHECERLAMLLEPLGVMRESFVGLRPGLEPLDRDDLISRFPLLNPESGKKLIGVAPGSVWGTKRWPVESFTLLVEKLCRNPDHVIVLMGSESEKVFTEHIVGKLSQSSNSNISDQILDLSGATSLDDLRALYPLLSLLICNDSSPVHYGSAFNTPTLAIFGATVSGMGFGPLATRSKVAEIDINTLSCRPCSDHGPKTCPEKHFKCMKDLQVEQVFGLSAELLRV